MFSVRKQRTLCNKVLNMRKLYKLKHKLTGLYYTKSCGHISDKGSIYSSPVHSLSGRKPNDEIELYAIDSKWIKHKLDILKNVGKLEERPCEKWDIETQRIVQTGKTYFCWSMTTKVSDFEKEIITEID